jgi:NADH-quinone oxidoreductase subunit M
MTVGGLEVMIALPAVGAGVAAAMPGGSRRVTWFAIGVSSLVLAWSLGVWASVVSEGGGYHFESDGTWIAALDVGWRLGVDSLSAPLVVLTALLSWCCLVALLMRAPACGGRRGLVALVLLIEAGSIGTFVSLDLVLFFVFFEVVLIPMWFVVADWGDEHDVVGRRRAATRFLVVTVAGSAVMLVAFLLIHAAAGTFDIAVLSTVGDQIGHGRQVLIAVLLMIGLGAKVPVWPLHFWLPDAHSKAPTVGSVLLAGVLLKLGTYGLLRFWYDVVPSGAVDVAPYLGAVGVVGIIYGALACLAQDDLKRLIAYSSIGHMGFVVLAVSTLTPQGLAAANFANVAHGAITGLLFFLVGGLKDRVGTSSFAGLGRGLYGRAPRLAGVFAVAAMASLGLPGLAGFWGEMLSMLSAYSPHPDLPQTTYLIFMAVAGLGAVLTTVYFVAAVRRLCQGVPDHDATADIHPDEWIAWSPLLALTVVLGIFPAIMLWSAGSGGELVAAVTGR